ncbi:hypothetical protein [Sphingomonas sp. LB2R24]|uniref:hypothetical protein n=1 Tax=Sphingomonas sorbitolis TaxID=3096165 RepID=UPI002FCAFE57
MHNPTHLVTSTSKWRSIVLTWPGERASPPIRRRPRAELLTGMMTPCATPDHLAASGVPTVVADL